MVTHHKWAKQGQLVADLSHLGQIS